MKSLKNLEYANIEKLTRNELAKVVQNLAKNVNRNYKSLKKSSIENTPATRGLENSGGKITTRGKNRNELVKEFIRANQYIESKTGTVRNAKKVFNEMKKRLNLPNLTSDDIKKIYGAYQDIKQRRPVEVRNTGSSDIIKAVREMYVQDLSVSKKSLAKKMLDTIDNFYIDEEEKRLNDVESYGDINSYANISNRPTVSSRPKSPRRNRKK